MANYLKFDAESILTTLKVNIQNSEKYSDQLFDGSNLSIILETLSLMFENMTYIVNNEATQASFGDTTIYESINKLVKKLAYNPRSPSTAVTSATSFGFLEGAELSGEGNSTKIFSKYLGFQPPTGKTVDSNGNPIYYALAEDYTVVYNRNVEGQEEGELVSEDGLFFYNGVWTKYDTEFTTSGTSNETFELNINQETDPVSDLKLFAYYEQGGTYYEYRAVRNLFDYTPTDKVFEVRVNEDKEFTVRFGDGVSGAILPSNVNMFFVYLRSNGTEGEIGKELINVPKTSLLQFGIQGIGDDIGNGENATVKALLGIDTDDTSYIINEDAFKGTGDYTAPQIYATIDQVSTTYEVMETVSEIKAAAPTFFRSGGRLLSASDFENYIIQYFSDTIHDSKAMNNWEYMSTFMKWTYDYDVLNPQLSSLGYRYSDSCDFNNIYLWLQPNSSTNTVSTFIKNSLDAAMKPIKVLTSETVFLDSIKTYLWPFVGDTPADVATNELWPESDDSVIRIERDPNSLVSVESIRNKAIEIFDDYFNYQNNTLGGVVDPGELHSSLLALSGVSKVETTNGTITLNGVSLAKWTNLIVDAADFVQITGASKLESFQFPVFYDINSIINKLEVVDSNYSSGGVEY
jgi:hypothetical protein